MHTKTCIIVILSAVLLSCADIGEVLPPAAPDIPIHELLAAEDTITVDGKSLTLSTYMWRDFMPISPPDGKPLIGIAYIDGIDTASLPSTIRADAIWIVYDGQVWRSLFNDETSNPAKPNRLERVFRNGPKWGPGVYLDVIVRLLDGAGGAHLLRASHQYISRTD
jgi:hypothetical protein